MLPDIKADDERLSWEQCGDLVVLQIDDLALDYPLSLKTKATFFDLLAQVEQAPDVKGLLMLNAPGAWSDAAYRAFIERLNRARTGAGGDNGSETTRSLALSREETASHQFISAVNTFSKVFMMGLQGPIAPPFFGSSLACDFRLVSSDFSVNFSHLELGIPPCGGLGFFLPRYLGQGRAVELLLASERLTAEQALVQGLVTRVISDPDFKSACVEQAHDLVKGPRRGLRATRDLLHPPPADLNRYLDKEFEALERALHEC